MNETAPQQETQPQTQALQKAPPRSPVLMGGRGLEITDLDSLWRVSTYISKSGLAPKGIESPEAIFTAIEFGLELGMPPMSALQNIAVINGRPGVYGDMPLALVRASGLLEDYREDEVGKAGEDNWGFRCTCRRVGSSPATETFTVGDAKRANLWNKPGPWTQHPKRMLKFRARAFLLRDNFGDVLKGVKTTEELLDQDQQRFEHARNVTPPDPLSAAASTAQQHTAAAATSTAPAGTSSLSSTQTDRRGSPDDEKAEAEMGLAPALGVETASLARGQEASPPSVHDQLAEVVTGAGFTFDEFVQWGKKDPMIGDGDKERGILAWDTFSGFADVPAKWAKYLYAARSGVVGSLKRVYGERGNK